MKLSIRIILAFSSILLLSIIDTASNYLLSVQVKKNSTFLNKSQEIIRTSGRLQTAIIEMQSSFRGFLLTKDSTFLQNYNADFNQVPVNLLKEKQLVTINSEQISLLDSISGLHDEWMNYADSLIFLRGTTTNNGTSENEYYKLFEKKFKKGYGEHLTNRIVEKFRKFDRIEYELRARYANDLLISIQRTHSYSLTFFILTLVIGIGSIYYIVYFITKRIKHMVQLAEGISLGNFASIKDDSNDELSSLSQSLNVMSSGLNKNISELKKRNDELDKFAYVVSHDLKAPLRGIHNAIKWIEEDLDKELTPEMQKYLSIIPERTLRMEKLINGLLDYARTREKTREEVVDVNELVKEIVDSVVPGTFKLKISKLPVIFTERLKLEQVFTNLISNAVNYTPGENGRISIGYRETDLYEFSVKDEGIGIEPEYHEKIFEIFQTLREKGGMESTGIGLSIVKKILDDMHCSIRVKSELNKGSEFIFTWPKKNTYHDEKQKHIVSGG